MCPGHGCCLMETDGGILGAVVTSIVMVIVVRIAAVAVIVTVIHSNDTSNSNSNCHRKRNSNSNRNQIVFHHIGNFVVLSVGTGDFDLALWVEEGFGNPNDIEYRLENKMEHEVNMGIM